ncbi:hypothetical protein PC121_g8474 [Phytophthora cactorum]|nr:hypothetical protein PC120_g4025 [Phytophthora cactorum]KAG3073919.1 hypothetical protein PC121_g8474 [Phytophthora cactorum]
MAGDSVYCNDIEQIENGFTDKFTAAPSTCSTELMDSNKARTGGPIWSWINCNPALNGVSGPLFPLASDEAAVEQEKEKQDEHELMGGIGVKRSRENEGQGKEEEPGLKRQELDVVPKANHESRLHDNLASFVRQAREYLELSEDEAAPTV